ncbi:hypothetical protein BH23ACT9_BH23ACT9_04180 [soil metagenome]
MWARYELQRRAGSPPITHAGVIGQVWRGGSGRQARLAVALRGVDVRPLDDRLARAAGVLLGATGRDDVIDAAVALLAHDDDCIATSDPDDLSDLVMALGRHVDVIPS